MFCEDGKIVVIFSYLQLSGSYITSRLKLPGCQKPKEGNFEICGGVRPFVIFCGSTYLPQYVLIGDRLDRISLFVIDKRAAQVMQ